MNTSLYRYAPIQLISSLSVFVLISVHAKGLSLVEYGSISLLLLSMESLRAVGVQWVVSAVLRLYPARSACDQRTLESNVLTLLFISIFIALILLLLGLLIFVGLPSLTWFYLSVLLLVKSIFLYLMEMSRLDNDLHSYRVGGVTNSFLSIIITFLALEYIGGVQVAILSLVISYALSVGVIYRKCRLRWDPKEVKELCSYGLPLMVSNGVGMIGVRLDRFAIAIFLGMEEVGTYSAISNILFGLMSLVFMVVAVPLYPELSRSSGRKTELSNKHANYLSLLCAVVLPSFVGVFFIVDALITIFLSGQYLDSAKGEVWVLLLAVFIINFKGHYVDHGLQFSMKTNILSWISFGVLVINLFLVPLMTSAWGLMGAACALALSSGFSTALTFVYGIREGFKYAFDRDLLCVVASVVVMAVALWCLHLSIPNDGGYFELVMKVSMGVIVYSCSMIATNAFDVRRKILRVRQNIF